MSQSYIDHPYRTFQEAVPGALDGKEYFLVELAATTGNVPVIQLYTGAGTTGPAIGVAFQKLKLGDPEVNVRLLGKGGTLKVSAGGAIAYGARVIGANGGQVVTTVGANVRSIGIKLTPGTCAANDIIEILDVIEPNGTFAN